jgi:hypothetical protein
MKKSKNANSKTTGQTRRPSRKEVFDELVNAGDFMQAGMWLSSWVKEQGGLPVELFGGNKPQSLPAVIKDAPALEAILICQYLILKGRLPRTVEANLSRITEEVLGVLWNGYRDNTGPWDKNQESRRARIQEAAIRRIAGADAYKIPTKRIKEVLRWNNIPLPVMHGANLVNFACAISEVLEFCDTSERAEGFDCWQLSNYARRVRLNRAVAKPWDIGNRQWVERNLNSHSTIQSLTCVAYREDCEEHGLNCPSNDNLKNYLQTYVKNKGAGADAIAIFHKTIQRSRNPMEWDVMDIEK